MSTAVEQVTLSEADARELTDQIAEGLADVHELIVQAWEGQAWRSLGFSSWDDWIDANFRGLQLRPPREQRSEVVQSMREAGMSIRAIAQATDLSVGTVHEAGRAGVQNRTPDDPQKPTVVGLDGKSYAPQSAAPAEDDDEGGAAEMSLDELGIPLLDSSQLPGRSREQKVFSGEVIEPGPVSDRGLMSQAAESREEAEQEAAEDSASWWEGPRAALVEAESRCVALLEQRRAEPRLVEDPQDPGPAQLTMTAARTVLAAGGVIVDLGVEDLNAGSQAALRKVLGTVIESLDGVIGDLEEAGNDEG